VCDGAARAQLREAAADLPERWWFAPDVNDAVNKRLARLEPKKAMQARPAPCGPSLSLTGRFGLLVTELSTAPRDPLHP